MRTVARLKAELLSNGVVLTDNFLAKYGPPFIEKRRAYGSSDPVELRDLVLPQEMYLLPSGTIVAVNIRRHSKWRLDYDGAFFLSDPDGVRYEVTFPLRPEFYDYHLADQRKLSRVITLYGGSSLGLFIYGRCALVDMGKACQYCSIEPNHRFETDFENIIRPRVVEEAVELALTDEQAPISQVMLNGGNFRDMDRSFLYYVDVVKAARRAIDRSGRNVELHLIVFPPQDLELFGELADQDVCVAMNTEVFDPERFERYCPGKTTVAGQQHIISALVRAAELLGEGHAYSIMVGGLEPIESMQRGMGYLADAGVTPIINVFHADPGTPLAEHPPVPTEEIMAMGKALQGVFARNDYMRPFYLNCGRNALDTEAFRGLF